ncbi:citryl-CoA lyase [Sphingomonas koreensis]|nr:citryl-CoA lyase [Sphingomonas koreensis]
MSADDHTRIDEAEAWWRTSIIDIHPGEIRMRGYAVEDLIGRATFPQMIWLMLRGDLPTPEQSALLEAVMVGAVDHGPQAPSIAIARMAVTCGLPLNGAMASAVNALDDVHGGAGEQCMELYEGAATRIDGGAAVADAVEAALDASIKGYGKIIPGFGHRFHPIDPRAPRLLSLVDLAATDGVVSGRYAAIGRAVEEALAARKGKRLPMNIDGVSAVVFCELGFLPPLGRGLFLLSRSVGILAHAWEQQGEGHRIKGPMPKSIPYTFDGPPPRPLPDTLKGRTTPDKD